MADHWLCIHLPRLPLEVFNRGSNRQPLAVFICQHRASILLCNDLARQAGIQAGMSLAAARALSHSLLLKPRNDKAEQQALKGLAAWSYQFSSQVCVYAHDALLLEIQGSFELFGGHDELWAQVQSGLKGLDYRYRLASAPTPLAALCLARCARQVTVKRLEDLPLALADLPLSVLDWEQASLDALQGMGVHRLGVLLDLPRSGLSRRFGQSCVDYLDRMLGYQADPQQLYEPPRYFRRRQMLPVEVAQVEALLFPLRGLLAELCGWLQGLEASVQQLQVSLRHREQRVTRVRLGLQCESRDPDHLFALLRERLRNLQLPEPVSEVELYVDQLLDWSHASLDLFARERSQQEYELLDRLRARLGERAVHGLSAVAERRPEYAWRYSEPGNSQQNSDGRQRPLWLLPVPRLLDSDKGWPCLQGRLELDSGRERVEAGWWDEGEVSRDYFIARNSSGAQYWIYRELDGARRWFLQGVFE